MGEKEQGACSPFLISESHGILIQLKWYHSDAADAYIDIKYSYFATDFFYLLWCQVSIYTSKIAIVFNDSRLK